MTALAIEAQAVSIRYGKKRVVEKATLSVPGGSVYALLGRNGGGKSSLVRVLLGAQRPQAGEVRILGEDVWTRRSALMKRVGYVPEDAVVELGMTVGEMIALDRALYLAWDEPLVERRLDTLSIARRARFGELSKGERRQILFTLALAHSPDLLILDDPTLGLDVVARKRLYDDLLAELADRNTTTFLTTHDLAGIEGIATRVGILHDGAVALEEDLDTLKSRFRKLRRAADAPAPARTVIRSTVWGEWVEEVVADFEETEGGTVEGGPLSLEEIFIALTGGKDRE